MTINSSENTPFISISENVKIIKNEMSEAAIKSGRKPEDVKLMAVTKTVAPIFINWAIEECGIDLIGENKVQDMVTKMEHLPSDINWHLIGHLHIVIPLVGAVELHVHESISAPGFNADGVGGIVFELEIRAAPGDGGIHAGVDIIGNIAVVVSLHDL